MAGVGVVAGAWTTAALSGVTEAIDAGTVVGALGLVGGVKIKSVSRRATQTKVPMRLMRSIIG
jgi:hypothetical protein